MWESRVLRRAFERLELHEGKLSRAVLRGGGGGDVTSLPDPGWATTPVYPAQGAAKWIRSATISIWRRWFRLLKGHERRIHGHKHAGVRIVQEGSTTALALDAHRAHRGLFTVDDLLPYRSARMPECQRQAMNRRKIMRKARSKTKQPKLLVELERRYRACSSRV